MRSGRSCDGGDRRQDRGQARTQAGPPAGGRGGEQGAGAGGDTRQRGVSSTASGEGRAEVSEAHRAWLDGRLQPSPGEPATTQGKGRCLRAAKAPRAGNAPLQDLPATGRQQDRTPGGDRNIQWLPQEGRAQLG